MLKKLFHTFFGLLDTVMLALHVLAMMIVQGLLVMAFVVMLVIIFV
jgi:hypothetical protein